MHIYFAFIYARVKTTYAHVTLHIGLLFAGLLFCSTLLRVIWRSFWCQLPVTLFLVLSLAYSVLFSPEHSPCTSPPLPLFLSSQSVRPAALLLSSCSSCGLLSGSDMFLAFVLSLLSFPRWSAAAQAPDPGSSAWFMGCFTPSSSSSLSAPSGRDLNPVTCSVRCLDEGWVWDTRGDHYGCPSHFS